MLVIGSPRKLKMMNDSRATATITIIPANKRRKIRASMSASQSSRIPQLYGRDTSWRSAGRPFLRTAARTRAPLLLLREIHEAGVLVAWHNRVDLVRHAPHQELLVQRDLGDLVPRGLPDLRQHRLPLLRVILGPCRED